MSLPRSKSAQILAEILENPLNLSEFALLIGMSPAWVSQRIAEGMPCVRSGKQRTEVEIDPRVAIPWLFKQQRKPLDSQPAPESARDRVNREQADRLALENRVRRGELVMRSHVAAMLRGASSLLKAELDGSSGRCASELAGISDIPACRAYLLAEHRRIQSTFADRCGEFAGDN